MIRYSTISITVLTLTGIRIRDLLTSRHVETILALLAVNALCIVLAVSTYSSSAISSGDVYTLLHASDFFVVVTVVGMTVTVAFYKHH